jgi:serine/threonine protein kinase
MSFLREPDEEPIPGYRLIEPLGSGGFGEAWKCEAPGGLFKAIKFVFGNLNSMDVDGARAEQELKALNRVKDVRHPFVLSMDRIEVVGGELVIVMELADRSLHDAMQECLSAGLIGIPRDTLLRYIRDAAEGLDHMNEKHNLQHLDIKPRNLFLVSDRVKVGDFGLVKHLERTGLSGVLSGVTPLYAPPETFTGAISGRSDQYSLAICYQELLTGQRPFNGKNARQLAQQHINEAPELRALPEAERPVVARALSKDPAKRFPNCLAFLRALYTARTAGAPEVVRSQSGPRPKTMVDTMEDILLEQMSPEACGIVDDQDINLGSNPDMGGPSAEEASRLGMTVAQPSTGALRPTLLIGLGAFGRRALLELRCRFLDRFGDLDKTPLMRFLYIDVDAEAVRGATHGSPEVALKPSEVHHLPLQAVSHYRRRQLDHLNDWLPREKLYTMPRSLKTQGSRALGRLAFSDNYLRLVGRFRRELQLATHADALYQSVNGTGLALRDATPRVYVLAAAGGGSSGFLTDIGYALRRLLRQMHHPEAPVTALVFCGAPDDPATPPPEQANVYATLTELNHFADPCVPFAAQYGLDGPRLSDEGAAFDNVYVLPHVNRTSESRRDALAHLGSYLFHELTTPLGMRLEGSRLKRAPGDAVCFRSLGTYGIWFPRGLLLRLAARHVCQRLLEQWQAPAKEDLLLGEEAALLEGAQARILADPELQPESLARRITEAAAIPGEGEPGESLTRLLANVEEQSRQMIAQDDAAAWAHQALDRVRDWLGNGVSAAGVPTVHQRKSRVTKALEAAAAQLAAQWEARFTETAYGLLDNPGRRIALAEAALGRFIAFCADAAAVTDERLQQQAPRGRQAEAQLQAALESCAVGSGFSWFGNNSRRQLRLFVDHLAVYARQCMADDVSAVVGQFFACLRGRLDDRLRDLTLCRQRLRHIQETLANAENGEELMVADSLRESVKEEPIAERLAHYQLPSSSPELSPTPVLSTEAFWEAVRESATHRVVLPEGVEQLETAANRFLASLNPEHWDDLDQSLQDQVLAPRHGLFQACMNTNDLIRHLAVPLVNQAVATLGGYLPITDVAQVELASAGVSAAEADVSAESELIERMRTYQELAAPLIGAAATKGQAAVVGGAATLPSAPLSTQAIDETFLLIPASEAGKQYGEEAQRVMPGIQLVNVPGQADLMFCREQTEMTVEDLDRILRPCRRAYQEAAGTPQSSPHARFDIQDWTPLDP